MGEGEKTTPARRARLFLIVTVKPVKTQSALCGICARNVSLIEINDAPYNYPAAIRYNVFIIKHSNWVKEFLHENRLSVVYPRPHFADAHGSQRADNGHLYGLSL
jgi:hypothetical protein